MPNQPLHSAIVVISWWSNCLGLACLWHLATAVPGRALHVVQVGKSEAQKRRFRRHLPVGVEEIAYPATAPGEHGRVIEHLVRRRLKSMPGAWFVDHDTLLHADSGSWFAAADRWLAGTDLCLCLAAPAAGPAITAPAFWLSPARWPTEVSSFAPIPYRPSPAARRPDRFQYSGVLRLPAKDTLVHARDELIASGRAGWFPLTAAASREHPALAAFPDHTHLGGASLFAGRATPPWADAWVRATLARFAAFFAACPKAWLDVEDEVLLRRFYALRSAIQSDESDGATCAREPFLDLVEAGICQPG